MYYRFKDLSCHLFCIMSLLFASIGFSSVPDEHTLAKPLQDELSILESLLIRTLKQLDNQKKLKDLMIQFKIQKKVFAQGNETKQHAFEMVKTASQILDLLSDEQLKHLFPSEYLEELALFSSIANKSRPGRS